MRFLKMQGLGNDFILMENIGMSDDEISALAIRLCDRHFGIGADGLVILLPSQYADIRMRIFNSDGSEGEMCGNALRCFARYVYEKRMVINECFSVETLAGVMRPKVNCENGEIRSITVDLGEPILQRTAIPVEGCGQKVINEPLQILGTCFEMTCLFLGVPHCVIFVKDVDEIDVNLYGPLIENHHLFPRKINVHFVQVVGRDYLKMRVWERGAGLTLACGTGASASLVAAVLNRKADRKATVELPGGCLMIHWAENNNVYMSGPAEYVFQGELGPNLGDVLLASYYEVACSPK